MNKQVKLILSHFNFNKKLSKLFKSVVANFYDLNNPLRVNNFAFSMRELLRNYFALKAPDSEISKTKWFILEKGQKPDVHITRRHRLIFLISGGLNSHFIPKEMNDDIDETISNTIKEIDHLSKLTHINLDSYPYTDSDSKKSFRRVLFVISGIFSNIDQVRRTICKHIHHKIESCLNDDFWSETIQEIDCLSTHSTADSVYEVTFSIDDISATQIKFSGNGLLSVDLQYGSTSDLAADIGATDSIDLPFDFSGIVNIDSPEKIEITVLDVDNSSFYGDSDEDL